MTSLELPEEVVANVVPLANAVQSIVEALVIANNLNSIV
jgi:hypothetical protein